MVKIKVLGAFEARVGGGVADLGGTRQRAVLARLVAAGGRMVPVDQLIDDLWPGEAPARALAGVQAFVSHLRRALEPDRPPRTPASALVTRPPGYALRLDEDAVDVWRFERLVRESADPGAAWAAADEALELWRGPAYAEFADLPWAEAERTRLAGLRLTAVERRAEAMLAAGATAQAVLDLEVHTAAHPLREEPRRLLALGLYRSGRQADALAVLREIRALLAEELGVDPGPALQALEGDILRQSAELDPAPRRAPEPVAPARRPGTEPPADTPAEPLAGRDRELAEILAAVGAGRRLVLLSGEAGVGKTALADRVCRELAAEGWEQSWGRTPEVDGAPAAWAWAELLRGLNARYPAPEVLAPMLDDDALAPAGDLTVARFRLHRAVGRYLAGVAETTSLAVVLEDLHRADEETLGLLAGLPEQAPGVLFLVTYRNTQPTDALADALASLARHEPVRMELAGIDADAVAELVGSLCSAEVDAGTLKAIAERTAGNPFFVRETARLLASEGAEAAVRTVPSGVGDVLRRRVSRLPAAAQTVLRTAAVVGRDVDPDLLTEICGVDEDTVLDALEAALVTGLMTEEGTGTRFAHVLVRDTLYGDLSRLRRSRLHARVADALERRPAADPATLAHHHLASGTRPDRVAHHARRAAEAAEARFAHRRASELWSQALDAHDRSGTADPRARLDLVARLVRALALSGDLVQARIRRGEVLDALRELGDPELTARVITAYDVPTPWTNHQYGAVDEPVVAAAEEALGALPEGALRSRLLTTLAMELETDFEERGARAAEEAVEIARRLGEPELLAHALNGLYMNSYRTAEALHERDAIALELLELAERHSLGLYQVLGHLFLQQTRMGLLDPERAEFHSGEGQRLARQYERPLLADIAAWAVCQRLAVGGRFDEATEAYRRTAEAFLSTGLWGGELAMSWLGVFTLMFTRDRLAELEEETAVMWEMWGANGVMADLYALVLHARGKRERAREIFSLAPPVRYDYFYDLLITIRAFAAIRFEDRPTARETYDRLLPYAGRYAGMSTASIALCPVSFALGELARFLGLDASEHYARAVEVARKAGAPHWEERALAQLP
ncbi:BTAD domain-containing putative transcriptional regulator [Actinocorallia aurantiaca]|uniref:BTAD domain-containing putative transcriptional regulator n=1 Tax=Actinocorallia aurantiaca TaxID=46204 RepID=A0ABN3UKC1_9ACTN